MARSRRRPTKTGTPAEPRGAEARYITTLRQVWGVSQAIVAAGVAQLMAVWPEPVEVEVEDRDQNPRFGPPPVRPKNAWNVTDAALRRAWPLLAPDDIRDWAPWATSRSEAARILGADVEDYTALHAQVRRSIEAAQQAAPLDDIRRFPHGQPPGPQRFRIQARYEAPVVLGPDGIPLPPPPRPRVVSTETISQQIAWMDLQISQVVTSESLERVVDEAGRTVDRWNRVQLQRVLGIDLRAEIPGLQSHIDRWRDLNVGLIESGIRGPSDGVRLRSLLEDVSETVERAHAQGIRVETLAADLQERFGVSDSRAELIARDQVLKLNGQINQRRQRAVGISEYVWVTSRDERVRRAHARLDGQTFAWDAPPEAAENGSREHPGQSYQCRCIARPKLPSADEFGEIF